MLRRPSSSSTSAPDVDSNPAEPAQGRRFTDLATGGSIFGPKLHIRGSITGSDAVEIAGQVEGPIEVEGLLHVAEGARVTGSVSATDAVIEGELQGRLAARGRVELRASAKVRADVHATTVAIAEGCFFDGRIHMGSGGEGERGPTHFREKRRRRGRGAHPEAQSAAAPEAAAAPAAPAAAEPEKAAEAAAPAAASPGTAAAPAPAAAAPAAPPAKQPSSTV